MTAVTGVCVTGKVPEFAADSGLNRAQAARLIWNQRSELSAGRSPRRLTKRVCRLDNRRFSLSEEDFRVTALLTTNLGDMPLLGRGKVRDLYAVDDALLLVATDRISAFDHVLGNGNSGQGQDPDADFAVLVRSAQGHCSQPPDHGRRARVSRRVAALCRSTGGPLDAGEAGRRCFRWSAWRAATWRDRAGRNIGRRERFAAFRCRPGLQDGSRLPEPVFTPATKSQDGAHDENISFGQVEAAGGRR